MSDVVPIIETLEAVQLRKQQMPDFRAGDTVRVWVLIKEGDKERTPVSYTHLRGCASKSCRTS